MSCSWFEYGKVEDPWFSTGGVGSSRGLQGVNLDFFSFREVLVSLKKDVDGVLEWIDSSLGLGVAGSQKGPIGFFSFLGPLKFVKLASNGPL